MELKDLEVMICKINDCDNVGEREELIQRLNIEVKECNATFKHDFYVECGEQDDPLKHLLDTETVCQYKIVKDEDNSLSIEEKTVTVPLKPCIDYLEKHRKIHIDKKWYKLTKGLTNLMSYSITQDLDVNCMENKDLLMVDNLINKTISNKNINDIKEFNKNNMTTNMYKCLIRQLLNIIFERDFIIQKKHVNFIKIAFTKHQKDATQLIVKCGSHVAMSNLLFDIARCVYHNRDIKVLVTK